MNFNVKVSLGLPFASKKSYVDKKDGKKYEADLKDGDIITILDAGTKTIGAPQYGSKEQFCFKVKTRNGDKVLPFNQTSINNMVQAFGGASEGWAGKEVKVWIDKVMGKDGYQYHAFVGSLETTRDEEDGLFDVPNSNPDSSNEDLGDIDFGNDEDVIVD